MHAKCQGVRVSTAKWPPPDGDGRPGVRGSQPSQPDTASTRTHAIADAGWGEPIPPGVLTRITLSIYSIVPLVLCEALAIRLDLRCSLQPGKQRV